MARVLPNLSRSLKEFRLLPAFSPRAAGEASLKTRLCRGVSGTLSLRAPIVGAAMQAVTGEGMAIALARLGGIGVLPVSQPIESQCAAVEAVRRFKAGFQTEVRALAPEQELAGVVELMRATGYTRFPVTDTGLFHGRLVGVLTDKDDLDEANRQMVETGRGFLPIVSEEGTLLSVVFKKDRDKHLEHPDETVDANGRLRVAAAVSTHPEDRQRVQALIESGVDAIAVDASDGHTEFQAEMLAFIKQHSDVPVIAGNVVTAEGFHFLAELFVQDSPQAT